MARVRWRFWAVALSCACGRGSPAIAPDPAGTESPGAQARTAAASAPGPVEAPDSAIAFIENDYPRALDEARARGLPLFVDAWATWCHTCLSLRSFVFPDPVLRPLARRFVWLSLDTERAENAAVVARLGVRVLPTLFVLDASTERPRLSWPGSLTAVELARLLEGFSGPRAGQAADPYEESDPPTGDPASVDMQVTKLAEEHRFAACAARAADALPGLPAGTFRADVVRAGIGCAEELPTTAPERAALAALAANGERIAGDPSEPILADDRSDLYDYVVGAFRALGRTDQATRLARAWLAG
jgi:hypothetical protein